MPNPYFRFKQFTIYHDQCAMKVTTDGCLFGAWVATQLKGKNLARALDIGAGSGLLSLMVAQQNAVPIVAVELDADAAAQARQNVAESPWASQVAVQQGDVLHWRSDTLFPVIFSNPPFYESELVSGKQSRNVAHHGEGLRLLDLFQRASELLAENGSFYLLLPAKREKDILQLARQTGWYLREQVVVHPSPSHPPFRLLIHFDRHFEGDPLRSTLFIKDHHQAYSAGFISLLKDYYLYL